MTPTFYKLYFLLKAIPFVYNFMLKIILERLVIFAS